MAEDESIGRTQPFQGLALFVRDRTYEDRFSHDAQVSISLITSSEEALEREGTRGDSEREAKAWREKLAEADQERHGYLRLATKGRMTDDDLDRALAEIEETRETAEGELETLRNRRERIEQLERDK